MPNSFINYNVVFKMKETIIVKKVTNKKDKNPMGFYTEEGKHYKSTAKVWGYLINKAPCEIEILNYDDDMVEMIKVIKEIVEETKDYRGEEQKPTYEEPKNEQPKKFLNNEEKSIIENALSIAHDTYNKMLLEFNNEAFKSVRVQINKEMDNINLMQTKFFDYKP